MIVIGDGVIGLSTAYELALAGVSTCLVGVVPPQPGTASGAAAGLLAPSIGALAATTHAFFAASLDRYPAFLDRLRRYDPGLDFIRGLIEIPGRSSESHGSGAAFNSLILDHDDLARLEPEVPHRHGSRLFPDDGAIDNVRLVAALRAAVNDQAGIRWIATPGVAEIDASAGLVRLEDGRQLAADFIVLAAGAWSPCIAGLPRPLPVVPLKGQMLAVESSALRHPVMGDDVYLVPREREVVIGATAEHAGFDITTNDVAIDALRRQAVDLVPSLAAAPELRRWAGIRPATPDMLPILGADPELPRLIYACGHSKNGILLAPATAAAITALVRGTFSELDIAPFAITRFSITAATGNS